MIWRFTVHFRCGVATAPLAALPISGRETWRWKNCNWLFFKERCLTTAWTSRQADKSDVGGRNRKKSIPFRPQKRINLGPEKFKAGKAGHKYIGRIDWHSSQYVGVGFEIPYTYILALRNRSLNVKLYSEHTEHTEHTRFGIYIIDNVYRNLLFNYSDSTSLCILDVVPESLSIE